MLNAIRRSINNLVEKYKPAYGVDRPKDAFEHKIAIYKIVNSEDTRQRIDGILKEENLYGGFRSNKEYVECAVRLDEKLKNLGIGEIKDDAIINSRGKAALDCQDWAFSSLDLDMYKTNGKSGGKLDLLLKQDLPRLIALQVPELGAIVVYINKDSEFAHYGLVSDVNNAEILVKSKWGGLSLFRHKLEDVPSDYGNRVAFFKKTA